MSLWSRVANVFRSERIDHDLDEELQFHLERRIEQLTAAGMTPEEAAAEARRRFGSPLRAREESRDVKLLPWLDSMMRDVRMGARMLRRNAGVTATAVVSLSLALGACATAFSLLDALVFRPLPVRTPGNWSTSRSRPTPPSGPRPTPSAIPCSWRSATPAPPMSTSSP